jgi:tetratricopeptide (TPR) repeat protein
MKWILSILFVLFLFPKPGNTMDEHEIDSLVNSLQYLKDDTSKVNILNKIADGYLYVDYAQIDIYANQALRLSEELDYKKGVAESYNNLGIYFRELGVFEQSIDYLFKSLKIMENINNRAGIARCYNLIGIIYYYLTNYDLSLEYYNKALEINIEQNDVKWIAGNYNNVGMIYKEKGDYNKARKFHNKSLMYYNKSLMYYKRALKMNKAQNNTNWIANNYGNIGSLFQVMDNPEAIVYFEKRLRIKEEQGDLSGIASANYLIGNYYNQKESYAKALPFLKKSYEIAKEISLRYEMRKASQGLSVAYEKLGDYEQAYLFHKVLKSVNDSLNIVESSQRITRLKMQHDYKISRQLAKIEYKETELYYFALAGALLLILIVILLFYGKQRAQAKQHQLERKRLELEKQSLQEALDFKNTELQENVKFLVSKNELISDITRKLLDAKPGFSAVNQQTINEIIMELKSSIDSDIWEDFELRFKQVHGDFYTQLNSRYPGLTPNEQKLCAFLRLDMSSREISAITNQSIKSIETARTRLRKKMGLSNQKISLSDFLSQF